jgi:hypothetical protein
MKRADIRRIARVVEPWFEARWKCHPNNHDAAFASAWRYWLVEGGGKKELDDLYDEGGCGEPFARAVRCEVLRSFGFRCRTSPPRLRQRRRRSDAVARCGTAVPTSEFQWLPGVQPLPNSIKAIEKAVPRIARYIHRWPAQRKMMADAIAEAFDTTPDTVETRLKARVLDVSRTAH